jgi:hypothetical protein
MAGEEGPCGIAVVLTDRVITRIDMNRHRLATLTWFKERL